MGTLCWGDSCQSPFFRAGGKRFEQNMGTLCGGHLWGRREETCSRPTVAHVTLAGFNVARMSPHHHTYAAVAVHSPTPFSIPPEQHSLYLCCLVYGGCTIAAASTEGRLSALLLAAASVTWGMQWPITSQIVNSAVPSDKRATIISVMCMLGIVLMT